MQKIYPFLLDVKSPKNYIHFINRTYFIITVFLLSLVFKNNASAQVVIYSQNFGTTAAFPAGWTPSNIDWQNKTDVNSSGYTGASAFSNAQFLNNNTLARTLTYDNNLSTVGYQNVSVLWGARLTNPTTITVTLSWSADGTTWNNVAFTNVASGAWTATQGWALVNGGTRIGLPAGASGIANLRLRLSATASAATPVTSYRIDDFTVEGCFVPSITATTTATCVGGSTGTITAAASGGTAPYTYSLNTGAYQASATFTALAAGSYTVNAKSSAGCTGSTTVTVSSSSPNLLVNPGFELPVVTNLNTYTINNIQPGTVWGSWTVNTSGGLNIVKVNGTAFLEGADNASDGFQYIDLTAGAVNVTQAFTLASPAFIYFNGNFSNRQSYSGTYAPWSGYIEILNGSNAVVATSNTLSMTAGLGDETWFTASGNTLVPLPAGTYTYRATIGDYGHFDNASVNINVSSTDDQNATASNSWIGHMYSGTAFNNYVGQFTETENFNELFGGSTTCFNVVSGGVTRSIYTETFSVKYKMNSTRKGFYVMDLGSDDGSRLTVDGVMVYNYWSTHAITTKASVLINLTGASSLLYEFYENAGANQVMFNNLTLVMANALATNTTQNICLGNNGSAISGDVYGTLPAGITLSGTGYQWSYSTTAGGARTDIAGATAASFTPLTGSAPFNVAGTYYIYRSAVLSSTNNVAPNPYVATNVSNAATVTVSTAPSATINYTATPYCSSAGTASVTRTGTTGGTYSSTAGLVINTATGDVTLATSTAGTYTVTYTIAAAGGCAAYTITSNITITTQPNVTGTYTGNPYCSNSGTAYPTGSSVGAPGTLSSTAGLIINSSSGVVNLATSTPGTYLITYSVTASGGCAVYTNTYNLTINAAPSATISYASSPYCSNAGTATVTRTGTAGGTYSSTAGLTINSASGDVTTGTSTAGTYTVTYTVAASGGCATYTATTSIIIKAAPAISQIPATNIIASYRFEGNANDATGNNNGTLQNAPATTTDRFNVAGKAYSFNGSSQFVSTANSYNNPVDFTISIWFKTSTTSGGKLIGFGNSQTGSSSNYDRHIYMNNAGQVYFGVYPGAVQTVNSTLSYNDGNWHLATASLSSTAGMMLYMDGAQVGVNASILSAQNYTGYWKIGFDNNSGWTSSPASNYFSGSLDDVLIYQSALTPAQVATLYKSPDGAGNNGPVCSGSTLTLNATTVSGATYSWSGPGFTSTFQNPSSVLTAGVYMLQVTVAGCTSTAYTNVTATTVAGQWTGNISTDWATAGNWCSGIVPTSSDNVIIAAGPLNMPAIVSTGTCKNLTINAGATVTVTNTGAFNIAGILTNNGTYTDNGTTSFNGTTGQQTSTGVTTFNNLIINNSNGFILSVATVIKNNLTLTTGTLNVNAYNITIAGNWINNSGVAAFTAGVRSVTFNGTVAQSLGGSFATTFNDLIILNTGSTVTLNVNTSVAGNLLLSTGTFDLGAFSANRTAAGGVLTVSNNTTLKIGSTNTFPINYATNTLAVAGTVEYSGTNQAVANQTYGNLTLSSSGGVAVKTLPGTPLAIVGNLTSLLGSGTSVLFTGASNLTVNGNVSIGASTTFSGGGYSHTISGNWVNSGTFNGNTSTIIFGGSGKNISGTGAQNFNNLTVAASLITFSNAGITLSGSLATTGAGSFIQATGGTLTMTGAGTTISGSGISLENLTVSGTVTTAASLFLTGNLSVSGSFISTSGTITLTGSLKTINGGGTITFNVLAAAGTITSNTNFTINSALSVSGSLTATSGTAMFTGTSTLSGTANLFNTNINGTSLQLTANSVLGVANLLTITAGTLDVTTSAPNTVNFNGPGAQNINAITYNNLTLSNGNTKTAVAGLTVNNSLTINIGTTFIPGAFTHSIYFNWNNYGTFTAGTSTIQFLGTGNSTIIGATTFNNLTLNKSTTVTDLILQSNITASTVNMLAGTLLTGTYTITVTTTRTGNAFILGNIQRTHAFTTGVAYAFEGPDNTINFSSVTGVTSITVSVSEGSISDFPFGGSVARLYNITVPAGTYNATLRLHYEDDELNGSNESTMALWNYNGTVWGAIGKTANDVTANYVEQSGLTNITNRWTFSDNSNVVQWNGSASTDWNTAANWTIVQGSASRPPAATDIANIGTIAFTFQPTISNAVSVKNINFGSVQPVTLSMAPGGTLNTGDIHGTWASNVTHTVNANNQSISMTGGFSMSDGVTGHAINLNIGTGTVDIIGPLNQSGGANISFTGTGNLNLGENYNYTSGTFTSATGTVTYNGTASQLAGAVNYNNLIINKSAGAVSVNSVTNIVGNLTVTAGKIDNYTTTNISGNVVIAAGATMQNHNILHVGGNWTNNGTYTANAASIFFDGAGTQNISATTFNNFNINKPIGSVAVFLGNIGITGNFTVTSGTLNAGIFDLSRQTLGGTLTIGDLATVIISGNNVPANFSSFSVGAASTIIFDGTSPQLLPMPGIFGNLIFRNGGIKTVGAPISLLGNLTIETTSTLNAGAATITLNGNWINNGTFIPSTSTVLLNGTGKTIAGATTFNSVTANSSYTFLNDMTFNGLLNITSSGSLTAAAPLVTTLNGDLINSGILNNLGTTTFTGNALQTLSLINSVSTVAVTVNFNGSVSPVLNSTSAPQYGFLNINNTGGINPSVDWTILYALTVGAGASFNGGTSTHNLLGNLTNNGTITSSGTMNFIPGAAAAINFGTNYTSTGRTIFGGAGAITISGSPVSFYRLLVSNTNAAGITPSSNWPVTNNFFITAGSIFNAANYNISVGGNISNTGTLNSGTSTFIMNGAAAQDIYTISPFNNLTINKTGGAVTLSSNATVNGTVNFIAGQIQTGANLLIQPAAGTVTGAGQTTGWVNGNLQKNIATGATVKNFEVGDGVSYTPVSTVFSSVTTAGDLLVFTTAGDHANLAASPINGYQSVNRYWTILNTGIVFTNYAATFNFVAGDIDAGSNTALFNVANHNGSSWSLPVTTFPNPLNTTATGLTIFDHFVIGEICNKGTAISYAFPVYCTNAGTASPVLTGNGGGTYASSPGLSINATTGAIDLAASTPGTYIINYNLAATVQCASYFTTTTVKIGIAGMWTGAISNAWNDISNWVCAIPGAATDAIIPGGLSFYPTITGTYPVNNVNIQSGGILTVSGGTLQIAGGITNTDGTFNVSSGTIEMNGTAAQTIPAGAFLNNNLQNLIISNNVDLGGPLNVTGILSFGAGGKTLNTHDTLTLKSSATATARIADITNNTTVSGNIISGKVTIERYIPARRAWRLLSSPLSTNNPPSIHDAWQEGSLTNLPGTPGNPWPGYGFPITGGSIGNGFDQAASNVNPTIKYYNGLKLIGIPSTNIPINTYPGYFAFVRGNRGSDLTKPAGDVATTAVLRMKGEINTGPQSLPVNATGFTLAGNPYPSPIDFHSIVGNSTNINDKLYVWDPNSDGIYGVGKYITLAWNPGAGSYNISPTPVSPVSGFMQSGEAFFVESQNGISSGTLNFNETDKKAGGNDKVFRPVTGNEQQRVNLLAANADGSDYVADGVLTTYADINSNAVDRNDAIKWNNSGENLWIARDGNILVIERRHTIDGDDTTFLNLTNLWKPSYKLQITTDAMENSGLYAVVKDKYSATINNTPINLGGVTDIVFNINSDPASYAANRFSIVFGKQAAVLPVTFVSVTALPRQKDIVVKWVTADELNIKDYTVETSLTGTNFTKAATLTATANNAGGGGAAYTWLDANATAGLHYYRIKSTEISGKENYSIIVKAGMGNAIGGMAVSPNPVTGNAIHLQLNNMAAGKYQARLIAANGQVMLNKEINHAGGDAIENIPLTKYITKGMYRLDITKPDGSNATISVAVE